MTWMGVVGHDEIVERFRRMIERGRLPSTFLFIGPEGVGKFTFAMRLAQALFCERHAESELTACGHCPSCHQVIALTHPDLVIVQCPPDRSVIPLELLIGEREQRMREGMVSQIATRPLLARRKVAIIDDADALNDEGANALLKTLEEPPAGSVIILISASEQRQLPTIRSRAHVVRFQGLGIEDLETLFREQGISIERSRLEELADLAMGGFAGARELADPELDELRQRLWSELGRESDSTRELAALVNESLDAAGKESPVRRAALARLVRWTEMYYRRELKRIVQQGGGEQRAIERLVERVERCDEALEQIDANANLATLVECWVDDVLV